MASFCFYWLDFSQITLNVKFLFPRLEKNQVEPHSSVFQQDYKFAETHLKYRYGDITEMSSWSSLWSPIIYVHTSSYDELKERAVRSLSWLSSVQFKDPTIILTNTGPQMYTKESDTRPLDRVALRIPKTMTVRATMIWITCRKTKSQRKHSEPLAHSAFVRTSDAKDDVRE